MGTLTAAKVRAISEPGRYSDGGNLYLNVSPGGTKSWIMRLTIDGTRTDRGLGSYKKISIGAARKLAVDIKHEVKLGHDPRLQARMLRAAKPATETGVPTFRDAALVWHELNETKHPVSAPKIMRWLELHVYDTIGDTQVDEITRPEIVAILNPLRRNKPATAKKVHSAVRDIFRWVVAHQFRPDNPADDNLRPLLVHVDKVEQHHAAVEHNEVADALHKLTYGKGAMVSKLALEFVIFTGCRQGEARGATWGEIDGDVWRIPAARMKAGRDHEVPLSVQAQSVLQRARGLRNLEYPDTVADDDVIFVNPDNGKAIGANSLVKRCHQDKLGCTPHGFRTSLTGWAVESGYSNEAIDLSLAHQIGNRTKQAYYRTTMLDVRRELLQAWADYVDPPLF